MGLLAVIIFAFAAANSDVKDGNIYIPKHDQPGQYHVIPANK